MIQAERVVQLLRHHRFGFFTGVPCSYLAGPIALLSEQNSYLPAANEGAALALAAGAAAAGTRPAVFVQNSGFGNLINPLTSLLLPYRIPVLIVMSLRGWPDPDADEPQHRVMGRTTHSLLDTLGVPHWTIQGSQDFEVAIEEAAAVLDGGTPAALLVAKGAISGYRPGAERREPSGLARSEVLQAVLDRFPDSFVVSTTGFTSRELFALSDSERRYYMQGSMGHAASLALGLALAKGDDRRVVVLDGDGAALMHLGSMATVGNTRPPSLVHVLLDNGAYESTGGQVTGSRTVRFTDIATAVGYRHSWDCPDADGMSAALTQAAGLDGPSFVAVRTKPNGGTAPPRATSVLRAADIHARFSDAVTRR